MSQKDESSQHEAAPGVSAPESQEDRGHEKDKDKERQSGASESDACMVVGVGASAGGFEAFGEFLKTVPMDTGMAFVLVQHLDPHHTSALTELLRPRTELPVLEVSDGTAVRPNQVYVIPPNAKMTIEGGVLRLTPRSEAIGRYMPIDTFLCSLAEDRKSNAVGVILSGAATDGTLGLKAIKAEGGITFAQDESAKFDGMPRSAITAGVVDFVLPPDAIGRELAVIARHPYRNSAVAAGLRQEAPAFTKILRLLRTVTGVDFSQYKSNTILRRMERRMVLQKARDPNQYLELLEQNPAEVRALSEDVLINVTEFFRDPKVFDALKEKVIPEIFRQKPSGEAVRVWVPGCSTGEELYSIAICLAEYMNEAGLEFSLHIFGSDLSERSIEKARAAIYSPSAVSTIPPERLKRFFMQVDSGYQVVRSLRDKCVFAVHNVTSDPPFSRMDLISCRNLLIYLGSGLQDRVMNTLSYALQPKGFLVLGNAERPGSLAEHFEPLEQQPDIYVRKASSGRPGFELPARVAPFPVFREDENSALVPGSKTSEGSRIGPLQRQVDRLLLAQYAPPGVIIDDDYRIVEFRGDVGLYLAPDAGEADLDLFRMLRDDVALHLRAAVEESRQKNLGIRLEGIQIFRGNTHTINVAVTPVSVAGFRRHFLISFEETSPGASGSNAPRPPQSTEVNPEKQGDSRSRTSQLAAELTSTRRYLQSIIEELRSSNEEAQSSNEELQSSNEELQTAKEELQASNEELQTLNAEMDSRNDDLKQLTDDLLNILTSLQTPILLLDHALRIRRFTQVSEKLLNLIATDIGRPISDLRPRINGPDLEAVVRHVVDTLAPHESEVRDQDGRWFSLRVRPYRTSDNRIDGAVLQLLDINDLKVSLEQLRQARDYASAIVETVREPLVVLDSQSRIETANRAFFETFETSPGESLKQSIYEVGGGQFDFPKLHDLLDHVTRYSSIEDVEIERDFERIGRRTMRLNARRIEANEKTGRILLALEDITERKRASEARYRRLFEAAKDGILIADADTGEITDVNPFLLSLSGYPREEVVGRRISEVAPLAGNPEVESALERIRGQEKAHFPDLVLKAKSGRAIHVEVVANEYAEGARKVVQFNIRDITERKRFDRQLQHTQKLESLGLLAGGIAHDFNNLLTGIIGFASLGVTEPEDYAASRRYFRDILSAGRRAADLTRQMLAYAGKGRFVLERIDVSQLIRDMEPLIHMSISRMVAIQMELASGLPAVEADPGQIEQLILNLVINGAEAIGEGKPGSVTVRTEPRDLSADDVHGEFPNERLTPGKYIAIEVRDTGSGMDEATRAKIFDPFFTTKFQGRGLGLAAASGIVRSHKGAIRVFSSPGRGTSFQILLPGVQAQPAQPGPRAKPTQTAAGGTVLFVDDEETVRNLAKSALERSGWTVLLAENGADAIRRFQEHQENIALVILDVAMPIMGGEEALERIKAIRAAVPVIISSGYGESEAARRFAVKDMAGYLQKPYSVNQLMESIAVVLGRL